MSKSSIIFASGQLKTALSYIGKAVVTKPIVPILENVRFQIQDGKATLTTSDLQSTLTATVPVEASESAEGLLLCLPHNKLSALVASLEGAIVLTAEDEFSATIKCGKSTYKLAGEKPVDWPRGETKPATDITFTLEGEHLHNFLAGLLLTEYAVNNDELRPAMNGVFLEVQPDSIKLTSTNGYILSTYKVEVETDVTASAIMPPKLVRTLPKLIGEGNKPLKITLNAHSIRAEYGDYTAQSRLIDERFPDYQGVVPTHNPIIVEFDRQDFIASLSRVLNVANMTTHQVRLSFHADKSTLSAEDLNYHSEGIEEIEIDWQGDAFEIGFPGKMMMQILTHQVGGTVRFEMSAPNRAALIYSGDDGAMTLLMPQLLNTYA